MAKVKSKKVSAKALAPLWEPACLMKSHRVSCMEAALPPLPRPVLNLSTNYGRKAEYA